MAINQKALDNELSDLVEVWSARLRIGNWKIEAKWGYSSKDFHAHDCLGQVRCNVNSLEAWVTILHPDYRGESDCPWQVTLLHELLHIRLDGVASRDEDPPMEEEQAVTILSELLWSYEVPNG